MGCFMFFITYLFTIISFSAMSFNVQAQDTKPYVGQLYFPPLGILVTNDAKLKQTYHEQSGRILSRVTLDEKLSLLTACSLENYGVVMKNYIAAVQTFKQAHVNVLTDHVSHIQIPIDDMQTLEFRGPLQPKKKALFRDLIGRNFDAVGYRLLYQTAVKECNHEQSLLVKQLLTPDEFKVARKIKVRTNTGLCHYIELPDRYAAPHVPYIEEKLVPYINAITVQQKIALLHHCNMAARDTLTPICNKYKDMIPTKEEDATSYVNPSITIPVGDRTLLIALGYDELYEDTQQIVQQSGTPEQKALFNFQKTPEELGALFQK
jgi:hypothetical protein